MIKPADILLVDFDGTLVGLDLDWHVARAEAMRRGLPPRVRAALENDRTGEYWHWLDAWELNASISWVNQNLIAVVNESRWAIVSDNGTPVICRAVERGVIPNPCAIAARLMGHPLKPASDVIQRALDALGITANDDVLVVGDNQFDAAAAASAGVRYASVRSFNGELTH